MVLLTFAGIVVLISGILFLFSPQTIRNLNARINRTVSSTDEKVYSLRIGVGISLILISILAFFTVYYLIRRYS